jgi:hypothetical protein
MNTRLYQPELPSMGHLGRNTIMRGLFTNKAHFIQSGQTLSGVAGQAQSLRILRGRAWITVEGIRHDYWLFAGDALTVEPGRMIVVEADASDIQVEVTSVREPGVMPDAAARLGRLVRRFGRAGKPRVACSGT